MVRKRPGSGAIATHRYKGKQTGGVTIISGVMILLMMLLVVLYASRVGVFEQRVSANDMRQKQAFRAAETGIAVSKKYFVRNANLVLSTRENVLTDGTDGWLYASAQRWHKCSEAGLTAEYGTHPCYGESNDTRRSKSWYYEYDEDPDDPNNDPYELPIDLTGLVAADTQVTLYATLCVLAMDLESEDTVVTGCDDSSEPSADSQFMITMLSRGESDCTGGECRAEALITVPLANFSALNGPPPSVPLTTKSTFDGAGTMEIVANPNGGGIGVPLSVWAQAGTGTYECAGERTAVDASGGTWNTCYPEDWYGQAYYPEDGRCPISPDTQCACDIDQLSYPDPSAGTPVLGIDMFWDAGFPCSLFQYYFGVPDSQHSVIKNAAQQILTDCSTLSTDSYGIIWIDKTGTSCNLNGANVGTLENPVVLISQVDTFIGGDAVIFGVVFVYDYPDLDIVLSSGGNPVIYGALVADSDIKNFNGNFKLVYNRSIISRAHDGGGSVGEMMGGWTDFPTDWR